VFGYPISEEFREVNLDDGQEYVVQYFERARFEWHPGAWPERYDVLLGRLGHTLLEARTAEPAISFETSPVWTPTLTAGLRVVVQRGPFPVPQADVLFRIVEGPNQNLAWRLAGRTDDWGGLWLQYTGARAGLDQVEACVDVNRNGRCDAGEPRASAEVWLGLEVEWAAQPGWTLLLGQDATVTVRLVLGGKPFAGVQLLVNGLDPEPTPPTVVTTDTSGHVTLRAPSPAHPPIGSSRVIVLCLDWNRDVECDLALEPRQLLWVSEVQIGTWLPSGTADVVGGEYAASFSVSGVAGLPVRLVVTGANAQARTAVTDSFGSVELRYRGERGGTDLITACVDLNRNDACDANEPIAGPLAHHWVTGAQLSLAGPAVDGDAATGWQPGNASPAFQATATLEPALDPAAVAPRLFIELVDDTASARVAGGEQVVRWFSGVPLDIFVLHGGPGDRLRVRVWLDSDASGWLFPGGDDLLLEREVTLTG